MTTSTSPVAQTAQLTLWLDYHDHYTSRPDHHISGIVRVAPGVHSPQLGNRRDLLVYLPPSYHNTTHRYPVIYMHDGQNLFDHATSFAGEWGVDETMEHLGYHEGLEAIVVGIPNAGTQRLAEYTPFRDGRLGGGRGERYLAFVIETIKPLIDANFRTLPDRRYTGIMGSSLGGLISLYAFFRHPAIFGYAGVMSPSLWFAQESIFDYVASAGYIPGKLYLDAGTRELGEQPTGGRLHRATASRRYYASVRRMKALLVRQGYRPMRDLMHVEEKWADHGESSWGRRLAPALRFLLSEALRQTSG